ncbi:MAG: M28 family peptidase, partial [Chitinophagaceae bacterium]
EKYAQIITAAELKAKLTIVAGAGMEGRETGTEGQKKAAAYIESQFKDLGLKPANKGKYQQIFPLMEDTLLEGKIVINGDNYPFGTDFFMNARFNKTEKVKASKIVFAGYGIDDPIYNDYEGLDVKGAIVVLALGEPKKDGKNILPGGPRGSEWASIAKKIGAAKEKGAVGIFVVSPRLAILNPSTVASQRKTNLYLPASPTSDPYTLNFATTTSVFFKKLFPGEFGDSMIAKLGRFDAISATDHQSIKAKVSFDVKKQSIEKANSSNVLAMIEGTDKKDEYVFLTAHYDHLGMRGDVIYYGADDDGSGTVSVLEMATAFAKAKADGNGPRRTIVFMTVSGEEKGLWGSQYYAEHPVFPLEKTSVDLNTDMVGRLDPKRTKGDSTNYVYVVGDDKLSSDLKPISESINDKYAKLELDYKYNDPNDTERIYFRSDHYNFARKGVPIIFYFNGTHADYHRPTDTVDKINFDVMEKRVRFIFYTAWEMANRDAMLKRDIKLD